MTLHLNSSQMNAARRLVQSSTAINSSQANPASIWYGGLYSSNNNAKHNLYYDFGYPVPGSLVFADFYNMWKRNGWARGLVEKTISKTWQTQPTLTEQESAHEETEIEKTISKHFTRVRFWQTLRTADARSMVGKYGGLIMQLADGLPYDQPVTAVPDGIEGLVSITPAWEGQLEPSDWDFNPGSSTYGQPTMFRFNESSVDPESGKVRSFSVHPDRCFVWSEDRTTWGDSSFEPCYNALMDMEKIRGAGGEGFWKNAKSQPVLNADKEVDFNQLATMLGTDLAGLPDALDEVVAKWSKGFDESLLLQGMTAKSLTVDLPKPEEFFQTALMEVAASWPIPQKILTGMQTGERASTEDAKEWSQTNMARRSNIVVPNVMDIVNRFVSWGMLDDIEWCLDWVDLTAATKEERVNIADKMASVNQRLATSGVVVFTEIEIRDVAGYLPLEETKTVDLIEPPTIEGEDDAEIHE